MGAGIEQLFEVADHLFVKVGAGDDDLFGSLETADEVVEDFGAVRLDFGGTCQEVHGRGVPFVEDQQGTTAGFRVEVAGTSGMAGVEDHDLPVFFGLTLGFEFGAEVPVVGIGRRKADFTAGAGQPRANQLPF